MKKDWIYTQGNRFMKNGEPILLRGIGVGSWLNLEHFMMGVPGWDGELRACLNTYCADFSSRFTQAFFTVEDAAYIRRLGFDFIRVPINHHLFWDDRQGQVNPYGIEQLERLAAACSAEGLYFLLDMHTTPGGQNPDWHSECSTGVPDFWNYKVFRNRAVKIWEDIAYRFHNHAMLLGYDLLNEPVLQPGQIELLNAFYSEAIPAIRKWDPRHIIFLEGDRFSMDFSQIKQPLDDQWAYTYHFYPGVWDENLLNPALDAAQRRTAFAGALDEILQSMRGYQGPLLCGEMGYELSCLDEAFGIRLTQDTIDILEERESGWCLWCYKDARFMGLRYPRSSSAWMELTGAVAKRWNHHSASQIGIGAVDAMETLCPYTLTDEEKYSMQFIVRAALAHADVKHILQPALQAMPEAKREHLPECFCLDRCETNKPLEKLLRTKCSRKE